MTFNSPEYLIFLILVFLVYWYFGRKVQIQNIIVLAASYFFYGWWSPKFLALIISCSLIDYFLSFRIYNSKQHKLFFLSLSMSLNFGVLFYFKYFNFFLGSLATGFHAFNMNSPFHTAGIILPIGISFFTFQTLSYTIDIYKGRIEPVKDLLVFLNFTSFFAQILAGPIERASQLMPQFSKPREFSYPLAVDGLRQILYGLFKKMVVADKMADNANYIYATYHSQSSLELLLGAIFFYVQIYADFSGYSDIAIGTGKLLGFQLSTNFRTPFFAKTPAEGWSRWHITLTQWFRDYVYTPLLLKNKKSTLWRIFCIVIVFMLIGLWHGANTTFIVFGLLSGSYFIPGILAKRHPGLRKVLVKLKTDKYLSLVSIVFLITLGAITAVFFRSPDISFALSYLHRLFGMNGIEVDLLSLKMALYMVAFLGWEWYMQDKEYQFDIKAFPKALKFSGYYIVIFSILLWGHFADRSFIYFHF
jgi:alginate O-acetyltransferase complex protein AlgI